MRITLITLFFVSLALAGTGGPDGGGYYWYDQDENTDFFNDNWVDISGTGTLISSGWWDDDFGQAGSISWDFNFYGSSYSDIYVSENGAVVFEDTNPRYFGAYGDDHFPGDHFVNTIIAPFWTDFAIHNNGEIFFQDFGDRFVVMWQDIDDWNGNLCTFELICWEAPDSSTASDVAFLYDFTPNGPIADYYVIGMQGDNTTGTELEYAIFKGGELVNPTEWYLLSPDEDYFGGSNVVPTSWGRIKALD